MDTKWQIQEGSHMMLIFKNVSCIFVVLPQHHKTCYNLMEHMEGVLLSPLFTELKLKHTVNVLSPNLLFSCIFSCIFLCMISIQLYTQRMYVYSKPQRTIHKAFSSLAMNQSHTMVLVCPGQNVWLQSLLGWSLPILWLIIMSLQVIFLNHWGMKSYLFRTVHK